MSDAPVGIDMEIRREKVIKIARKFLDREFEYLDTENIPDYVRRLIVAWGVKEALYKMISKVGLSFRQHINVHSFSADDGKGSASVNFEELQSTYAFHFEEIEDFTLVYTLGNETFKQ